MKEQEVIKRLNFHKEYARLSSNRVVISETDLETVLSMLKQNSAELAEKSAEIEKKDKMIDLTLEFLAERDLGYYQKEEGGEIQGIFRKYNKDDWKQHFEEQAKKEGE